MKKEEHYLEQEIRVSIERGDEIKIVFDFSKKLILNLSSDKTADTQSFFLALLEELIKNPNEIKFNFEDDKEDLYHDITEKYLNNLETEIKQILKDIPEIKENDNCI